MADNETKNDDADVPYIWRPVVDALRAHPGWKGPTLGAVVLFMVLVAGLGFLYLSNANTTDKISAASKRGLAQVERTHNAEACTLRIVIGGLRDRAVKTSKDTSLSPSARKRAKESLPQLKFILAGQVTQPRDVDCRKLLRNLAKDAPTGRVK